MILAAESNRTIMDFLQGDSIMNSVIVLLTAVVSTIGAVWAHRSHRVAKEAKFEITNNHPENLRDAIDRMEENQSRIEDHLGSLDVKLDKDLLRITDNSKRLDELTKVSEQSREEHRQINDRIQAVADRTSDLEKK